MNPLIATQIASKLSAQKTGLNQYDLQLAMEREERKRNRRKIVGYTIGGLALIAVGRKFYKEYRKNKASAENDPITQAAKLFQIAMDGMGTDEKLIFDTARKIKTDKIDYKAVTKAYSDITGGKSLDADFQADLDTKEYRALMVILSDTYNPDSDTENNDNIFFKAIRDTGIYKTPDSGYAFTTINETAPVSGYLTNVVKLGFSYIPPYIPYYMSEFVAYSSGKKYWVKQSDIERQSKAQHDAHKAKTGGKMFLIKES